MCKSNYFQNKCCSITSKSTDVWSDFVGESTVCYSKVINNFFIINNHKKNAKAFFQNECCSITSIRSVIYEVILVKVQCVTVKLLICFIINNHKKYAKAIIFKMNVVV